MQKIELGISIENPSITILEGKALEQKEPLKIVLSGDIKSISSFLNTRKRSGGTGFQTIDMKRATIISDKKDMSITMKLDPENYYGATIIAKLELSDELKDFSINTTKMFTREELVKKIKFSKIYFDNAEAHEKVLKAYQTFNAKAYIDMSMDSDNRGNKSGAYSKKVTTELPEYFMLSLPIFKGMPKKKFQVEICLDVSDGSVHFWFESVELHNIIETTKDEIFAEELKSCEGFVIINK